MSTAIARRPPSTIARSRSSRERIHAAASEQRRNNIHQRGLQIAAADKKALLRKRQGHTSTYAKSSVLSLKAIFDEYDRDGSGAIDQTELRTALRKRQQEAQRFQPHGRTLKERQMQAGRVRGQPADSPGIFLADYADCLFDALDANRDSQIDFSELLRVVYPKATAADYEVMLSWVTPKKTESDLRRQEEEEAQRQRVETLREMFAAFDRNGDGKVSITEFRMAMLDHENWDEVDDLFEQYDADGSGEVDFEEFCAIVSLEDE